MDTHISHFNHHTYDSQNDLLDSLLLTAPSAMQQDHLQQQASSSMPFQATSGPTPASQPSNVQMSPVANLQPSQLNMNMLNNMMQIQSAGDHLVNIVGQNSQGAGPSNVQYNTQALLEQQFKLSQLQQLQQLQNQIFQQQIALISGQTPFLSTSPPMNRSDMLSSGLPLSSMKDSNSSNSLTGVASSYAGLPTPGPSSELRPRDGAIEFVSPMILNQNPFLESPISPDSSHQNDHAFSHSHQQSAPHSQHQHYNTAPPQVVFEVQSTLRSHPTSPVFNGDDEPPPSAISSVSGMQSGELNLSPIASPWFGASNNRRQSLPHAGTDLGLGPHRATNFSQHNVTSSLRTKRPVDNDMPDHSNTGVDPAINTFEAGEPLRKKHISASPHTLRGHDHPQPRNYPQSTTSMTLLSQPPTSPLTSPTSPFASALGSINLAGGLTGPASSSSATGSGNSSQRRQYRERVSKSVNSTPSLRGQRSRVGSTTLSQTSNPSSNSTNTQSPHVFGNTSGRSSKADTPAASTVEPGNGMQMSGFDAFDTPSPVDLDLSMPPPAPPDHPNGLNSNSTPLSSSSGSGSGVGSSPNLEPGMDATSFAGLSAAPLIPATPASIMNLSRNTPIGSAGKVHGHITQPSGHQASLSLSQPNPSSKDKRSQEAGKESNAKASATSEKGKETAGKGKGGGASASAGSMPSIATSRPKRATASAAAGNTGVSPALKAILPAGPPDAASSSQNVSSLTRIEQQNQQPRKTSHKAAEQKRRDSLKTKYDELRTLLPPIPLSTELDESSTANGIPGIPGAWPPRSSSHLPGSLPPRGPPKTGVEGPNKGVSKLQLLICGNEYIRVLKARVERRDTEIVKLRAEVGKLRGLAKNLKYGETGPRENDGDVEMFDADLGFDLDLDLEKDVDAVELQDNDRGGGGGSGGVGIGTGAANIGVGVGALESVGEQPDEEDDCD
ncbi:hypothetical protein AN958_09988 [Leucoagaricus sp. SymC.cos]|nr:hypothetical protein AN958_09988 [Leucoagaricus sp. SymC.cos]